MNDPRLRAAAKAVHRYDLEVQLCSTYAPNKHHRAETQVAIEAADRADHEAGIHRVRVDDATVERVAGVLQVKSYDMRIPWDDYERVARAVLAALTEAKP